MASVRVRLAEIVLGRGVSHLFYILPHRTFSKEGAQPLTLMCKVVKCMTGYFRCPCPDAKTAMYSPSKIMYKCITVPACQIFNVYEVLAQLSNHR